MSPLFRRKCSAPSETRNSCVLWNLYLCPGFYRGDDSCRDDDSCRGLDFCLDCDLSQNHDECVWNARASVDLPVMSATT